MMIKVICSFIVIVSVIIWMHLASNDKDFAIDGKYLQFEKRDKICIFIYTFATIILLFLLPTAATIFSSLSLPYLIIAAITDKKTKLVYDVPFYIFGVVATIIETIIFKEFKISVLLIFLFAQILAMLKMFGRGDRAMTSICGVIYYFYNPAATVVEALLVDCIMILIAEIIFYIQAIKERNLDGPFKLKESRPLGPVLCLATFIILIGVIIT